MYTDVMRKAFSLVELSIVLVILGLLVGGVLTGKALIRASELRAINTEYANFVSGLHVFRDKYFALPGDFDNAGAVWGLVALINCGGIPSTDSKTCNGDGDGTIMPSIGLDMTDGSITFNTNEGSYFWKQLANASLISGSFDNLNSYNPSKFPSAYWVATPFDPLTSTGRNSLLLVSKDGVAQPLLPEDAANIDIKLDDGKPLTGAIQGWVSNTTPGIGVCINGANYFLAGTHPGCSLKFTQGF